MPWKVTKEIPSGRITLKLIGFFKLSIFKMPVILRLIKLKYLNTTSMPKLKNNTDKKIRFFLFVNFSSKIPPEYDTIIIEKGIRILMGL
jgi:hypothetical protein